MIMSIVYQRMYTRTHISLFVVFVASQEFPNGKRHAVVYACMFACLIAVHMSVYPTYLPNLT